MLLYIETNFLMGVAMGREERLDDLLALPVDKLKIVLPTVCIMEAWSAFEDERKRRNRFLNQLDQQIGQLCRDNTSTNASLLLANLESARITNSDLLNDIEVRLCEALDKISNGRIIFLTLSFDALRSSLTSQDIDEPTDNLIFHLIKRHAHSISGERKVLLTGNTKDFHTSAIKQQLKPEEFIKVFADTGGFIGWFQAELRKEALQNTTGAL